MKFSSGLSVVSFPCLSWGSRMISQWISRRWMTNPMTVADRDRADDDEESLTQLVEMLDERSLLAMIEATRQPDPRHSQAPKTSNPPTAAVLGDGLGLLLRLGGRSRGCGLLSRGRSGAACGAVGCGGGSSEREVSTLVASCTPVTESLNSLMPTPSERPISGSRFAPKSSKARIERKIR